MKKVLFTILAALTCTASRAAAYQWESRAAGQKITFTVKDAPKPAKDAGGKLMTVVYLENLAVEKIGRNSNADDVQWLLEQGYRVIELDYAHSDKASSPGLTQDIIAINDELAGGTFGGKASGISPSRSYILMEGYRIQRDVPYYQDDRTVYNLYSADGTLYMDIAYPANPSRPVPALLAFSYSNSYPGNEHQRMFLGYTLSLFDDAILEGSAANGMAWAIADHPKYCDWGNGKVAGGANKSLGSIEVNPDAARKVKSAVRTLRHFGSEAGLGGDIAVYGFSRASTAASLAIGDTPFEQWLDASRCPHPSESSDVQAAVLGPGVFDYRAMPATAKEYTNMLAYCGKSADSPLWSQQGGALAIKDGAVPAFLFHNTSDEEYYSQQMSLLASLYDQTGSAYELLSDYGTGHSVPTSPQHLQQIYDFLSLHLQGTSSGIADAPRLPYPSAQGYHDLQGRRVLHPIPGHIYITGGKKVIYGCR